MSNFSINWISSENDFKWDYRGILLKRIENVANVSEKYYFKSEVCVSENIITQIFSMVKAFLFEFLSLYLSRSLSSSFLSYFSFLSFLTLSLYRFPSRFLALSLSLSNLRKKMKQHEKRKVKEKKNRTTHRAF